MRLFLKHLQDEEHTQESASQQYTRTHAQLAAATDQHVHTMLSCGQLA